MQPVLNSKYLIYNEAANVSAAPQIAQSSTTKPTELKLFYTNDWHGQTDNLGGILGASLQFDSSSRGKNFDTLKICSGDSYSGANFKKNSLISNLMNYMRFDACVTGNHEFDGGIEDLEKIAQKSNITKYLGANIKKTNGQPTQGLQSSIVKDVNGNKYGIIGLAPLDLKTVVATEKVKDIDVQNLDDTIKTTQNEINKFKAQGINKIILASHIGKDLDEKIASQLDGVDIIVGGHTHDIIEGAQVDKNIVRSKSGEPVIILQTGQNAEHYGILNAKFNEHGILSEVANSVIDTPRQKNSVIDKIRDDEVGISPQIGTIKEIETLPENRRIAPCAWTAMMADSMRDNLGTEIALINSANIRKVPQTGKLTQRDIEESAPMKNKLFKTTMSEGQLVSGIKNAAYRSLGAPDGYPGLLQCSGISYEIDSNGALLKMSMVDKEGKETIVDINNPSKTKTYSVALDSFLANGKEYPEMVPQNTVEEFDYDKDTTMNEYLQKRQDKDSLTIKDDGRLKIIQTSEPHRQSNNTRNI